MSEQLNPNYIFLDTDEERRQLVDEIGKVRRAVLHMVDVVPQEQWYQPRYHGWSFAAMLAHLHLTDNLCLLDIQLALIGIRPPIPSSLWDRFNDVSTQVFRQRVVETTVRGIQKNEKRVASFILRLPVSKFSKEVYDPPHNRYLTVEQALQEFFLHHWHEHLKTISETEGLSYEPPERPDVVM